MRKFLEYAGVVTAVLAIVLTGGIAWGDVIVVLPLESGDTAPGITGWSTGVINTTDTAGSASTGSLEVTSDSASGYFSSSFGAVDATGLTYINFYVNVENVTSFDTGGSMYPFGGGYMDGFFDYPAAGTAGWTYISADAGILGGWTDQGMDWSIFDGLEVGASDLVGTLLFDHFTISTTPEEGMLGAGGGGGAGPVEVLGSWTEGLTHAAEAGADMLIFTVGIEGGPDSDVSSVTYGGQAMTEVIDAIVNPGTSDTEAYVSGWYLNEAGITAASSGDFVVTWASTTPSFELYTSVFLSGVDQTNPIGGSTSDIDPGDDNLTTGAPLSTNDGDLVIGAAAGGAPQGFDWLNSFTEQLETTGGSAGASVASKAATGADEIVEAFSDGNFRQSMIGFVVQAGGGGAGPPPVPPAVDTDGDGFLDPVEVALGFDPNDAGDAPPATPVAGLLGLGLLSLGILAGGAALVRRKK